MAHITVSANPVLNISQVNEILETDPVLASFMNGYIQLFLENDQALKNMVDKKPDETTLARVASTGRYSDLIGLQTIPSGAAADYGVANNDTTTEIGYLADARIVKTHGDEIDEIVNFLKTAVTDEQINTILAS